MTAAPTATTGHIALLRELGLASRAVAADLAWWQVMRRWHLKRFASNLLIMADALAWEMHRQRTT